MIFLGWRWGIWLLGLYFIGYFGHNDPSKLSYTFSAPRFLAMLCGNPLPSKRLDFSPMLLQLGAVCSLVSLTMGHFGIMSFAVSTRLQLYTQLSMLALYLSAPVYRFLKSLIR